MDIGVGVEGLFKRLQQLLAHRNLNYRGVERPADVKIAERMLVLQDYLDTLRSFDLGRPDWEAAEVNLHELSVVVLRIFYSADVQTAYMEAMELAETASDYDFRASLNLMTDLRFLRCQVGEALPSLNIAYLPGLIPPPAGGRVFLPPKLAVSRRSVIYNDPFFLQDLDETLTDEMEDMQTVPVLIDTSDTPLQNFDLTYTPLRKEAPLLLEELLQVGGVPLFQSLLPVGGAPKKLLMLYLTETDALKAALLKDHLLEGYQKQ